MSRWTKIRDKGRNAIKKTVKGIGKTVAAPFEAAGHTLQAGVHLLEGDFSAAGKDLAKAAGNVAVGALGSVGITSPDLLRSAQAVTQAAASYGTLNFNAGSHALQGAGIDITADKANAEARAAQAAYDKEVAEAEDKALRSRRANLLETRKSLTPTLSKSSQGGSASGASNIGKGQGGIVLG